MKDTITNLKQPIPKGFKKFSKWSKKGRKVVKGSKATWFNGKPYFHKDQTVKYEPVEYQDYPTHAFTGYCKTRQDEREEPERSYFADGSTIVHCGGPCGDLYLDRDGNM